MGPELPKGTYIIAVSGGVDSVVLLDVLSKRKDLILIVAHYDHGIRDDSADDRRFVHKLAQVYGLPFEYGEGRLGPTASEAVAREARYRFLRKIQEKYDAAAVITAHHQDDLIETAIVNMLRGTGRKGLTSLASRTGIVRPLLGVPKRELVEFARTNSLEWREDSTNQDTKYLRNYVRHSLAPLLTHEQRKKLLKLIEKQHSINIQLDGLLSAKVESPELPRRWFTGLPHEVAREAMAAWLRYNGLREFDKPAIERAVIGAKTARPGKKIAIKKNRFIEVGKDKLALAGKER